MQYFDSVPKLRWHIRLTKSRVTVFPVAQAPESRGKETGGSETPTASGMANEQAQGMDDREPHPTPVRVFQVNATRKLWQCLSPPADTSECPF